MEVFIARQPIFNKRQEIVAYELLYRSNGKDNSFNSFDGDKATLNVITNSFITIGIEKVVENKLAFINFTEELLKTDLIYILPPKNIVVEILETVEPSCKIVEKCKELKEKGYVLALDDFVFDEKYDSLIKLADIIKVDFQITKGRERKSIIQTLKNKNLKFLAEKVETYEDFKEAVTYGYSFFQGYYFSRPVILSAVDIPIYKFNNLNIINEISKKDIDIETLEKIIIKDVSLSYKFLKLINSSDFCSTKKVNSVKEAITLIGEKEVAKWLYIIVIQDLGEDKSQELFKNSLIRAKFAELLSKNTILKNRSSEAYMMGMISMIDCFLNRPLKEILKELYINEDVKGALLGEDKNKFYYICKLIYSYERGDWENVVRFSKKLNLQQENITSVYLEAVNWMLDAIY